MNVVDLNGGSSNTVINSNTGTIVGGSYNDYRLMMTFLSKVTYLMLSLLPELPLSMAKHDSIITTPQQMSPVLEKVVIITVYTESEQLEQLLLT